MRFQAPRGTEDVLPADAHRWQFLEGSFKSLANLYGYNEVRTPSFEDTDLFIRSSGETSEIVTKQMYNFVDKGGRPIAFKPEGTAPGMRAVIEHNLCPPGTVLRLFYVTPIFRYERPQKGRLRESHQVGLELIGSPAPGADAEMIEMTVAFYERIGLHGIRALINSIGRGECRARYGEAILKGVDTWLAEQDEETKGRAEKNPMRLLDSKDPKVREALDGIPPVTDFLEDDCKRHFGDVQELLSEAGVPFVVAPEVVRGLDYYTGTVFEVHSTSLGAQSALCGGGRYDTLAKEMGGPDTPCVGVAMGIERALIAMEAEGVEVPEQKPDVFVVSASPDIMAYARHLAKELREQGFSCIVDHDGKSMKSQLRQADRSGAAFAIILGEVEIARDIATLRDLGNGIQAEVDRPRLSQVLARSRGVVRPDETAATHRGGAKQ